MVSYKITCTQSAYGALAFHSNFQIGHNSLNPLCWPAVMTVTYVTNSGSDGYIRLAVNVKNYPVPARPTLRVRFKFRISSR